MVVARALSAEALKMKRTLALWLALIGPLAIVALQVLAAWDRAVLYTGLHENPWVPYAQQILVIWSLIMLPLFVTLETALIAGLEHNNRGWKQLFALPIPRWSIYLAKQAAGMAVIGISWLALFGSLLLGGLVLRILVPEVMEGWPVPWRDMLVWCGMAYLGSWLLISIHTWVGLRWHSFVIAVGVGIVMTVAGVLVINHGAATYYPWTLPALVANGFMEGQTMLNIGRTWPVTELLVGVLGGIAVAVVGGVDVVRRDVL